MTVARSEESRAPRLSEKKGRELLGLLLLSVGLLLMVCLGTYHPTDPSLFHEAPENSPTRNLVGPVGAHISALLFSLFGLPILSIPIVLLALAWRRLRNQEIPRVVGRGTGAALFLLPLPILVQLVLGDIRWRGESMDSGGVIGLLVASTLENRLGFVGALLLLVSMVVIGIALLVQSSLGELLRSIWQWSRSSSQGAAMKLDRQRERRQKDKSRRQVIAKHLERVDREEDRQRQDEVVAVATGGARVRQKTGAGKFRIRKVRGVVAEPSAETSATRRDAAEALEHSDAETQRAARPAPSGVPRPKRFKPKAEKKSKSAPQKALPFYRQRRRWWHTARQSADVGRRTAEPGRR